MANVIRLPFPFRHFHPTLSAEDHAILVERLRILASGAGLTLKQMAALIPTSASIAHWRRVDMLYAIDLHFCLAWLEDNPSAPLDELNLVSEILNKWDANHRRTNPYWDARPSDEEAELNRRIVAICDRLIARQHNEQTQIP